MSLCVRKQQALRAIAFVAGTQGAVVGLGASATGRPASPTTPHPRHGGLFRAATEWVDAEHIKGETLPSKCHT